MDKPLTLSKLVQDCGNEAYAGGETFVSTDGMHELYFDGQRLVGIEKVPLNSQWQYVEKAVTGCTK